MFLIDFSVCASKWAVTGDDSQDLCGIEKLFYSLWKEIAGRALCLLSVPSHRESHGSGWKSLVGDRQPDPVCCWHISAGRVWGSQLKDTVLVEEFAVSRQGEGRLHSGVFSMSVPWRGLSQPLRLWEALSVFCSLGWAPLCSPEVSYCPIDLWHWRNRQKA